MIQSTTSLAKGILTVLLLLTPIWSYSQNLSKTEQEAANMERAVYLMNLLENRNDIEPGLRLKMLRDEVFDDQYIQHSPHVEDGKEAVIKVFEKRYERFPEYASNIKRTAAQDDLVWLHIHAKRTPDALGSAIIHIFRMKNGKFSEHWAVGQPIPETSKNDNGIF